MTPVLRFMHTFKISPCTTGAGSSALLGKVPVTPKANPIKRVSNGVITFLEIVIVIVSSFRK
jgi:hypothetical protein